MLVAIVVLLSLDTLFLFLIAASIGNIANFVKMIQAGTKFGQQAKNQFGNN